MNWSQLKTVLWLRWRLTRNQWNRGGNLGAVMTALVISAITIAAGALFCGAVAAGIFAFENVRSPATTIMLTWDIITGFFLIAWMIGLLTELQRSETIDLQRLMHLPVRLGQIFTVNYVASHAVFSILIVFPVMAGLALGLAISHGAGNLLLLPLSLAMIFMITAWTYCLRGWFAALMSNPRRRRSAVVAISMVVVLLSQLPNIYFNLWNRGWKQSHGNSQEARQRAEARAQRQRQSFQTFEAAHKYVPPLWLPLGARTIAEGRYAPALLGIAGCAAIGAAGLRRAYGSTVRFYRGDDGSKARPAAAAVAPAKDGRPRKRLLLERQIPGVPDEAAAVALGTFTSMLRAPEMKMQWAMAVMMTVVFGGMGALRGGSDMPAGVKPLVVTGLITMTMFMLVQTMANVFGFDRAGFRAIVLSPARRRHVLMGKNLANLPIPALLAVLVTVGCSIWMKISPANALMVLLQFCSMFLLVCLLANTLSIYVPYRVRSGTMKPTKLPAKAQLVMFLTHMLFPLAMLPAFIPTGAQLLWDYFEAPRFPIGLVLAALMAAVVAAGYRLSLDPLAGLLAKREKQILDLIGTEVE